MDLVDLECIESENQIVNIVICDLNLNIEFE